MLLKEYIINYRRMKVEEFSVLCGISAASLWHYFSGKRRPTQKNAEWIEKLTDGLVTVIDLRGEDARKRK